MRQKQASFRLEDWLKEDLENFMEDHNITERTEGLHKYVEELKRKLEEKSKMVDTLYHALKYYQDGTAKALVFKRDVGEIKDTTKKIAQKLDRFLEEVKQTVKEYQKLEADSTQKPQRKKRFRPVLGYEKYIGQQKSDGSEHCLRTGKLIYRSKECKKCKEKTPDYFEHCEELKRPFLKRSP